MKKSFKYFRANTGGNITGFVLSPVYPDYRKHYADAIMSQIDNTVEQVGFISPGYDGPPLRLDMSGGEFCGNATRAYGFYSALKTKDLVSDEDGDSYVEVYVSGVDYPLVVTANVEKKTASVVLPMAKKISEVKVDSKSYKVVELEGIAHMVVEDRKEDDAFVKLALDELKRQIKSEAYGILFYDAEKKEMLPNVYVVETNTLIKEGACGSGTVSMGYYLNDKKDEDFETEIIQRSGDKITLSAITDEEGNFYYEIGGPVEFSEEIKVEIDIDKKIVDEIGEKFKREQAENNKKEQEAIEKAEREWEKSKEDQE